MTSKAAMTNITSKSTVTARSKNCKRRSFNLFSSCFFGWLWRLFLICFYPDFLRFPLCFLFLLLHFRFLDGTSLYGYTDGKHNNKKIPNASSFLRNACFTFFSNRPIICREALIGVQKQIFLIKIIRIQFYNKCQQKQSKPQNQETLVLRSIYHSFSALRLPLRW